MISREDFCYYMEFYKQGYDFYKELSSLLWKNKDVVGGTEISFPKALEAILELIEIGMGLPKDAFGCTTLSWWVHECSFGDEEEMRISLINRYIAENNKFYASGLTSLDKLYDYLVWESEQVKAGTW